MRNCSIGLLRSLSKEITTRKINSSGGQPAVEGSCPYSRCDDHPRGGTVAELAGRRATSIFVGSRFCSRPRRSAANAAGWVEKPWRSALASGCMLLEAARLET
jgi:hypothetical protein